MRGSDEERLGVCPGVGMERPDLDFGSNAAFGLEYREEMSNYWEFCYARHRKRKRIKKSKENIYIVLLAENMKGYTFDENSVIIKMKDAI